MEYYAFSLVVAVVFVAELLAKGPFARVGRGYGLYRGKGKYLVSGKMWIFLPVFQTSKRYGK